MTSYNFIDEKTPAKVNDGFCSDEFPAGNYLVMLLMVIVFAAQFLGDPNSLYLKGLVLKGYSYNGFLGYLWLHTGVMHIAGNLATLAVFGRQTCRKIGDAKFFIIFVILGSLAAFAHVLLDGRPVIGASGAICGILGMTVVLSYRKLSLFGPWIILIWVAVSLAAALVGSPDAYIAHIAGFVAGMLIAAALAVCNQADCSDIDHSLKKILICTIK